jgi:hypothetical protein
MSQPILLLFLFVLVQGRICWISSYLSKPDEFVNRAKVLHHVPHARTTWLALKIESEKTRISLKPNSGIVFRLANFKTQYISGIFWVITNDTGTIWTIQIIQINADQLLLLNIVRHEFISGDCSFNMSIFWVTNNDMNSDCSNLFALTSIFYW